MILRKNRGKKLLAGFLTTISIFGVSTIWSPNLSFAYEQSIPIQNEYTVTEKTVEQLEQESIQKEIKIQNDLIEEEKRRIAEQKKREKELQIASITCDPTNITRLSNVTSEQLKIITKDTQWEGNERALEDLEKNYGINLFYCIAVSRLESGNGTSVIAKRYNNIFGINGDTYYENYHDVTMYFGDFQNRLYVGKGLTSVYTIGPKYCPPNRQWEVEVSSIMNSLYNKLMTTLD